MYREISSGWDFPDGEMSLEQNKLCLKLYLIGYKSKKSPSLPLWVHFLGWKNTCSWHSTRVLVHVSCSEGGVPYECVFKKPLGEPEFSPQRADMALSYFFIWFEIYFTRQSMWYGPSGKSGSALFLLSAPSSSSCRFPGNCHDESTERGNLSADQKFWDASESEVQLHRQRHGECEAQKF